MGIWGGAINIAVRLEQAGEDPGRDCIISGEIVAELGGASFDLESLPPIDAKGIAHHVAAFAIKPDATIRPVRQDCGRGNLDATPGRLSPAT